MLVLIINMALIMQQKSSVGRFDVHVYFGLELYRVVKELHQEMELIQFNSIFIHTYLAKIQMFIIEINK